MNILGISCFYHDSAAALLRDGDLVAAAHEERFTRKRHDPEFPREATTYCLEQAGLSIDDIDYLAFYDKPFVKFERILLTYLATFPRSLPSYSKAIPLWLKQKLWVPKAIEKAIGYKGEILSAEHHQSHAAAAFLPSPYQEAAILVDKIFEELIDLREDGSFKLDMRYFAYDYGLTMTNEHFDELFGQPRRTPESRMEDFHWDVAASVQRVTEEVMLRVVRDLHARTGLPNLCLAGGVALNCVANGRILREGPFENLWVQPAAGDAGSALGAALFVHHQVLGKPRKFRMDHAFWGPEFSDPEIRSYLDGRGAPFHKLERDDMISEVARLLEEDQAVVGWFQGRLEWGPRSLGSRSILADARNPENWKRVNLKIKFRESFRPFAPAVLAEKAGDWFDIDRDSPYMLLVCQVREDREVPAITHVDGSARLQTVRREHHPEFYDLLAEFDRRSGCPVMINTSFNVRGEPIVCTPEDAYLCFMRTNMDVLVLGNQILYKGEQPELVEEFDWRERYALD
jgi:carbamoyltransferase